MPRRIRTPKKERLTMSTSVSPELVELVTNRANELGLTRSALIALALGDYFSEFGQTPEFLDLEAMSDVYSDSHDGELFRLGYSNQLREDMQKLIDEALAKEKTREEGKA